MAKTGDRETRALAVLSSLPLALQLLFHVWEQWAVFDGRHAYVDRLAQTSSGLATFVNGVIFVVPLGAWVVLLVRALVRRGPLPGEARSGDPALARALGAVVRVVSPLAAIALIVHVAMFWGARIAGGQPPIWTYDLLRAALGQPLWMTVHAVLVFAITWHLAATLPDGLEALGAVGAEGRRSAFVVTAVFGACLLVLYAQLTGWLSTGLGTFWPIHIITPDGAVSP